MKASLSRCARCGSNDLEDRDVEKLVRGGDDVAAVRVRATVCHRCGERYFPEEAIRVLDQTRHDLAEGKMGGFRTLGRLLAPQPGTGR
jgi:YgiT-type zinc finger domain-containing protein